MSTIPASNPTSIDDRRRDLAIVAARSARSNTPTHLVLLGGLAVAGALLYLVIAWRGYAAAAEKLASEQRTAGLVVEAAGRLRALAAAEAAQGSGPRLVEGGQRIYGRIEQAGVEAGLRDRVPVPTSTRSDKVQGTDILRVIRDYDIRDPNLGAIIAWLSRACEAVPGLEVYSMTVRPEAQAWNVKIRFTRLERAEGS
ncbi:MAG: hypothetical protein HBSAPP03_09720 [Phycisphaerae bacterium]|nr:MAG: hypothetical protein HBSAPP03_09720 [Phycisphaerae bacterium]